MNVQRLTLTCACGWEISGTQDEVVDAAQDHGLQVHNMDSTREEILALARVIAAD